MFDIGFWEVALIALVALVVVGPKELPGLIRGVTSWIARARAVAAELKSEFDRELARADELKRLVERETELAELHKIAQETGKTIPIGAPRVSPPVPPAPPSDPGESPAGSPVDAAKDAAPPRDRSERDA